VDEDSVVPLPDVPVDEAVDPVDEESVEIPVEELSVDDPEVEDSVELAVELSVVPEVDDSVELAVEDVSVEDPVDEVSVVPLSDEVPVDSKDELGHWPRSVNMLCAVREGSTDGLACCYQGGMGGGVASVNLFAVD